MSRSQSQLESYIDSQLPDNSAGDITEAIMRTTLKELGKLRPTVINHVATSLSLTDATHFNSIINYDNASDLVVTIPNNLPAGFACTFVQEDAGKITFSVASGATLNNRLGHTESAGQHAAITLFVKRNSDDSSAEYILSGDTA